MDMFVQLHSTYEKKYLSSGCGVKMEFRDPAVGISLTKSARETTDIIQRRKIIHRCFFSLQIFVYG